MDPFKVPATRSKWSALMDDFRTFEGSKVP
jgi:hypothetical protein